MEQPHGAASAQQHRPMTAHEFARRAKSSHVVGAEANAPAPNVNPHMQGTNTSAQLNWRSKSLHEEGHLSGFGKMNRGTLVETGF